MDIKSSNKWYIASYFTLETMYSEVYRQYLKRSCERLGLTDRLICMQIADQGDWYKNTAEKPNIILNILSSMKEDDCLVFLDADATIEQYPILFDEIPHEYDIAFHRLSWKSWYGHEVENKELLSGTLFFRNNKRIRKLCEEWYKRASNSREWEQKILQSLMEERPEIKAYELPLEYIYIKTRPGDLEPLVKLEPVILHHQMSRFFKKGVKRI